MSSNPIADVRGFRDSFRSYIPKWLQNRKTGNVGYRLLWSMIMPLDLLVQVVVEGIQAPWPGVGTPSALPAIGQSRGLTRGESESERAYAQYLIGWLDTYDDMGSDERLVKEIQHYLGNTPMVRIVNRAGFWVTVATDGTISYATQAWNWDSISNPERVGDWADLWIVVYPCEWPVRGNIGSQTEQTDTEGIGHLVSRVTVDAILALLAYWKGAHTYIRAIIWSYDATLFDPLAPVGFPDGTWGHVSKNVGGAQVRTRNASARYWIPTNG